ncbi:dihydrofolate reductase family protein [Brachybacterium hainanense]|uniref:Dihydrofolate reductase family protein n=1 Tax=Brachybacterium hainanense TaxID=1541174 RepID=A0ABV6R8H2_9MICO
MAREIVYTGFMSLDGVVDSPGGREEGHRSGGWVARTPFLPEAFALKGEELAETSALLLGRHSYQAFAPIWRDSEEHAPWKDMPKLVVSTTLREGDLVGGWGPTTILPGLDEVARLRTEDDGGALFIHGSAQLARSLAEAGLVDRYHLLVFPLLLGAGKSIFPRADREEQGLSLRSSESYDNGIVKLIYDVVR